jgi:hypothetical protein
MLPHLTCRQPGDSEDGAIDVEGIVCWRRVPDQRAIPFKHFAGTLTARTIWPSALRTCPTSGGSVRLAAGATRQARRAGSRQAADRFHG